MQAGSTIGDTGTGMLMAHCPALISGAAPARRASSIPDGMRSRTTSAMRSLHGGPRRRLVRDRRRWVAAIRRSVCIRARRRTHDTSTSATAVPIPSIEPAAEGGGSRGSGWRPNHSTPDARTEHREEVDAIVANWTRQHDKHEAMRLVSEGNHTVRRGDGHDGTRTTRSS